MDPRTKDDIEALFDLCVENEIDEKIEAQHQDDIPLEPMIDLEMADFENEYRLRHPEE